jgi:rhodanese-related sulfurtransferase
MRLIECRPGEVKAWLDEGSVILIDVREDQELLEARIPEAVHMPLSRFDPNGLPETDGKRVAFLCAHGIRSQQVGHYLVANGMLEEAYNVTGGIAAWANAGLPYE